MTKPENRGEPAPIGERLLDIKEAAGIIRVNPRTLREYVRRGELQGRLIGRRWRFRRQDLDTFFENAPSVWDWPGTGENGD